MKPCTLSVSMSVTGTVIPTLSVLKRRTTRPSADPSARRPQVPLGGTPVTTASTAPPISGADTVVASGTSRAAGAAGTPPRDVVDFGQPNSPAQSFRIHGDPRAGPGTG